MGPVPLSGDSLAVARRHCTTVSATQLLAKMVLPDVGETSEREDTVATETRAS